MTDLPCNAICIGGPLDGRIVQILNPPVDDYCLHHISDKYSEIVLCYYLSRDLTVTQAMLKVFTAYGKKGKK